MCSKFPEQANLCPEFRFDIISLTFAYDGIRTQPFVRVPALRSDVTLRLGPNSI